MKKLFLAIFLSTQAWCSSDPVYISVSYYEGLGETFRVEVASSWPQCKESKKARKLFLDKTNELREIAIWRANGKMEEAGMLNLGKLSSEVEAIFAGASDDENPCLKDKNEKSSVGAKASDQ